MSIVEETPLKFWALEGQVTVATNVSLISSFKYLLGILTLKSKMKINTFMSG